MDTLKVYQLTSMCEAHKILMNGLVDHPAELRIGAVGIMKGEAIAHIAPPGNMVRGLMNDLFEYLKTDTDLLLIKSCVFHYEFEFIHPFTDGNGRMGRLWQTMILKAYSKVFEFLPIESLVKERQQKYYHVFGKSDNEGSSTSFIEFMLEIIQQALNDLLATQNFTTTNEDRMSLFKDYIGDAEFSRQDYLRYNKDISLATASRDLKNTVTNGMLLKSGDKRLTKYKFV